MIRVTRQKVQAVLRKAGFSAVHYGRPGGFVDRAGFKVGYPLNGEMEVCHRGYAGSHFPRTQSYLAALTAAGIECHLTADGRAVIVLVEQGGSC